MHKAQDVSGPVWYLIQKLGFAFNSEMMFGTYQIVKTKNRNKPPSTQIHGKM